MYFHDFYFVMENTNLFCLYILKVSLVFFSHLLLPPWASLDFLSVQKHIRLLPIAECLHRLFPLPWVLLAQISEVFLLLLSDGPWCLHSLR